VEEIRWIHPHLVPPLSRVRKFVAHPGSLLQRRGESASKNKDIVQVVNIINKAKIKVKAQRGRRAKGQVP